MIEFDYRYWTTFGTGSSVTFVSGDYGWPAEITVTLLDRDAEKVVLELLWKLDRPENPVESRFTQQVPAYPERRPGAERVLQIRDRRRTTGSASEAPSLLMAPPVRLTGAPPKEGDEVIELAGETWICHWFERAAKFFEMDVVVKHWESEKVPGGLVQVELRKPGMAESTTRWTLKSFEAKPL